MTTDLNPHFMRRSCEANLAIFREEAAVDFERWLRIPSSVLSAQIRAWRQLGFDAFLSYRYHLANGMRQIGLVEVADAVGAVPADKLAGERYSALLNGELSQATAEVMRDRGRAKGRPSIVRWPMIRERLKGSMPAWLPSLRVKDPLGLERQTASGFLCLCLGEVSADSAAVELRFLPDAAGRLPARHRGLHGILGQFRTWEGDQNYLENTIAEEIERHLKHFAYK